MTKLNLKKPFVTAVISSAVFASAIVAIPLIASAQNDTTEATEEISNEDNENSKVDRDRPDREGKNRKGFHVIGEVIESLGLEKETLRAGIESGQTLGEIAEANGIASESVMETIVSLITDRLNEAVAEGKITGEEALEKAVHIQERAEKIVNSPFGEGKADRDRPDREGKNRKGFHVIGEVIESLGLEKETLRAGIESGQTLGEIAEANGIASESVMETIVSLITDRLNEAVAEGKITGEEALEKAVHIQERAEKIVNSPFGEGKADRDRPDREGKNRKGRFGSPPRS